ncbi:MAG: hypothetical protein AAFU41_14960 [Pseudomonadota bacterium]
MLRFWPLTTFYEGVMRWFLVSFSAVWLASCGGGGGGSGGAGIDPRLARLDTYAAQQLRVLGDPAQGVAGPPLTPVEMAPAMGSYQLSGFATIRVEDPANPTVLYGDAVLTVDYDLDATTGTLDRFFGADGGAVVADYVGAIALTGAGVAQDGALSYDGTLTGSGSTLALSGSLDTHLLGDPFSAVAAADLAGQITVDSDVYDGTLVVVVEQD